MQVVLDASALLAFLRQVPGSELVDQVLGAAVVTSVNWAEVVQFSMSVCSRSPPLMPSRQQSSGPRPHGLSLADRACLSLGLRLNLPVLTCDRAWAGLALPPKIQLLR
jgi:PIN domain nuclease of toxin-antitoxin system